MDGKHRIEKVGQANAVRFGNESKQGAVAIEAPGATLFDDFQALFRISVEELVCNFTRGRFISQLQCFGAIPLDADNGDETVWKQAADSGVNLKVFGLRVSSFKPLREYRWRPYQSYIRLLKNVVYILSPIVETGSHLVSEPPPS